MSLARRLRRGFGALAPAHDVALVGGDTTRGPLCASVQLLGFVAAGRALLRSGAQARARPVCVTGTPGDAAAGLALEAGRLHAAGPRARRAICASGSSFPSRACELGIALREYRERLHRRFGRARRRCRQACRRQRLSAPDRHRRAAAVAAARARRRCGARPGAGARAAATTTSCCSPCRRLASPRSTRARRRRGLRRIGDDREPPGVRVDGAPRRARVPSRFRPFRGLTPGTPGEAHPVHSRRFDEISSHGHRWHPPAGQPGNCHPTATMPTIDGPQDSRRRSASTW